MALLAKQASGYNKGRMTSLDPTTYQQLLNEQKEQAEKVLLLEAENHWLREQLGLAKQRLYAPKSEQTPPGQEALLFNEAEVAASASLPDPQSEQITYSRRKARGPRTLDLEGLPVEERHYDLPEEERVCPQCAGPLHRMGEEVRNEVEIIPARFVLVKHCRSKYACRHCNHNEIKTPILTAPAPETAFPNSLASPASVAYLMTQKFVEGCPLYRLEHSFAREGLHLSRQTMANWMLTGAQWLEPLSRRMQVHLLKRDILHADETTLQVLKEPGRAAQTSSYLWLYRSGRDGPPIVCFEYQQTREAQHPRTFLKGFCGYLHVDGYQGYEGLPGVTLVGCFAHVRRKFVEAIAVLPAPQRKGGTPAHEGLAFCDTLFKIERDLHTPTPQERFTQRLERSQPVLEKFGLWLDGMEGKVLPKSALGQAIGYGRNQGSKLKAFLLDGRLEIDNNRSERAIKPFVIGRKNWLFANTPRGAKASAVIYSIVETAKENGLHPMHYLTYLFEQLPNTNLKDAQALDALLPWSEAVVAQCRVPSKSAR